MPSLERTAKQFGSDIAFPSTNDIRQIIGGTTIRKYNLHFTGTYKQGANAGSLAPDAPFSIWRRLAYYLGGAPLRDADGRMLKWWHKIQNGGFAPAFVAPSMVGGATTPISFDLPIEMVQSDLLPPLNNGFVLDTRGLDVTLVNDWGNPIGDLDVSAQAGSTLTGQVVRVQATDDPTVMGKASKLQISQLKIPASAITASATKDQGIQAKGPAYRGIAISARSGSTDWNQAAGDDSFIAYVSLVGDNTVKFVDRVPWADLQAKNRKDYGFVDPGWMLLDFADDHSLGHIIYTLTDRGQISDLVLTLEFGATVPANPWVLVYPLNVLLWYRPLVAPVRGPALAQTARRR
jgi:hypothetical protein